MSRYEIVLKIIYHTLKDFKIKLYYNNKLIKKFEFYRYTLIHLIHLKIKIQIDMRKIKKKIEFKGYLFTERKQSWYIFQILDHLKQACLNGEIN